MHCAALRKRCNSTQTQVTACVVVVRMHSRKDWLEAFYFIKIMSSTRRKNWVIQLFQLGQYPKYYSITFVYLG